MEKRVIVQVVGGCVQVIQIPAGVIVEVRDYDDGEDRYRPEAKEQEDGVKLDKDGNPYRWYEEVSE